MTYKNILNGESVYNGKAVGVARIIRRRSDIYRVKKGDIIVGHRMNPELFVGLSSVGGILTERGSLVCHAASIAREFSIPAMINVANARDYIHEGDIIEINSYAGIAKILFRKESNHNSLYITDKCNNNCIMCPLEQKRDFSMGHLSLDEIKKRIQKIPKDVNHVNISGGEPTMLMKDFFSVVEYLLRTLPKAKFSLLTNARMFAYKGFASKLKGLTGDRMDILAAFHSSNEKRHNLITETESFQQTVLGIENILETGFDTEIRVVISKANYIELENMAHFISQNFYKADHVSFLYMELTGKVRENLKSLYVSYEQIMLNLIEASKILEKSHIHFRLYHFPLCVLPKQMWNFSWDTITEFKKAELEECNSCNVRERCCGVFKSYLDAVGTEELDPIKVENFQEI